MRLLVVWFLLVASVMAQTVTLDESTVVNSSPLNIGTNLGGATSYGPGQLFKNLLYMQNPGLQGWQEVQIVPMKAAGSPSTSAATGYFYFDAVTSNYWTGATYAFVASATNPTVVGCAGTISTNTVANSGAQTGPVYTLGTPCAAAPTLDDYMTLRLITPSPSSCVTAWQCSGTLGGETGDLPTANLSGGSFTGQQAISMQTGSSIQTCIDCGVSGLNQDWIIFQAGQTFTWQFQTKKVSGSPTVTVAIQRTSGGLQQSFNFTPGASWAVQSHSFSGNESTGNDYSTCQVNVSVSGGTVEIVNLDLERTSNLNASNTTAYRDEVFSALTALAPASLREMDAANQFGQTLANWTTDQWGQLAEQYNMQDTYATTGRNNAQTTPQLVDVLHLCEVMAVQHCWITLPPSWTIAEYTGLMDFLYGGAGTTYGAKRIALGHTNPYNQTIPVIDLEFANEPWNQALWGESMPGLTASPNGMTSFGNWSNTVFAAIKGTSYSASYYRLVINMQPSPSVTVSAYVNTVAPLNSHFDTVALAPYIGANFTSCTTNVTCYYPNGGFAWQDTNQATSSSGNGWTNAFVVANQGGSACANCIGKGVAVYEDSTNQGNANSFLYPNFNVDQLSAVMVAQQMLEHLKIIGSGAQHIFTLAQIELNSTPIWGIIWEAGGEYAGTGAYIARPVLLSTQIANACVGLGSYYTATITSNVTYASSTSNGSAGASGIPAVFAYPFKNGNSRCLVLVNTDISSSHVITLAGNNVPTSAAQSLLTPTSGIDSNNETGGSPQVSNVTSVLAISGGSVALPPYSIMSLLWSTGSNPSATEYIP